MQEIQSLVDLIEFFRNKNERHEVLNDKLAALKIELEAEKTFNNPFLANRKH